MITAALCGILTPILQMRQLRLSAVNQKIADFLIALFDLQRRISTRFEHFSLGFEQRLPAAAIYHGVVLEPPSNITSQERLLQGSLNWRKK